MASATSWFKWPILDATTKLREYAGVVATALQAVEDSFHLGNNQFTATSASSGYPLGISLMALTSVGISSGGWPVSTGALAHVLTLRGTISGTAENATQFFVVITAGHPAVYVRTNSGGTWSPWTKVAGSGLPWAVTSGRVTFLNNSVPTSQTVAFPSGLFGGAPNVTATTHDGQSVAAVGGITADGCTVSILPNGGGSTFPSTIDRIVEWQAIQSY